MEWFEFIYNIIKPLPWVWLAFKIATKCLDAINRLRMDMRVSLIEVYDTLKEIERKMK